ncbi:NAD-dependent succinate-semialdehyde dehydrogenase [Paraburkholderia phytofirmans OLGA172]|uniref:NAD-dependent succinate-semialdehyde dehydrogenase n=1 Tax=Paraburkholderia phytofirmans OLGA172 TaxID=1417228 RepID=A0A160FSC8_9BURK|nr:NAD-dependent succinate-semialdehyde dehydrogenase [Paraburkholderia phytofirmans]ANB75606.1 NAD-dependent succinate-semialdehyde dehydrogenase [Paraburkholderia phytofirmans OLGA172]
MYEKLSLYIDGEFIDGGPRSSQNVLNPSTLETIAHLPHADEVDLDRAIAAAHRAFESWRQTSAMDRATILRNVGARIRDEVDVIARNITLDQGKPLAEAKAEVLACADHVDWHAEECRRIYGRVIPARHSSIRQIVVHEPVGVCAAFTPWNFPFNQAIRKVAAALGAGCTLILKGPEESPSAIMAIARLFHDAGLPKGCLNIVWGKPAEISHRLITSPIVRKISFTGSVEVGKQLAALAGSHMKRVTMELGGHAPVLVFDDSDVPRAAKMLAKLKVLNAGQVCVSPTRFFVQEGAYDEFVSIFRDTLASVKVDDGLQANVNMGPVANERRVAAMSAFVEDARRLGGKVLFGGEPLQRTGHFFPPTLITDLPDSAKLMREEPFGPIAPIVRFKDVDEGIRRANSLPFGLASYVFTGSLHTATYVSNAIEAGMVNINHFGISLPETPFGGIKDSGIGVEGGSETFDGYVSAKFITQR